MANINFLTDAMGYLLLTIAVERFSHVLLAST